MEVLISAIIGLVTTIVNVSVTASRRAKAAKEAKKTTWGLSSAAQKSAFIEQMLSEAFSGQYGLEYDNFIDSYLQELMRQADGNILNLSTLEFWEQNSSYYKQYLLLREDYLLNAALVNKRKQIRTSIIAGTIALVIILIISISIINKKKK